MNLLDILPGKGTILLASAAAVVFLAGSMIPELSGKAEGVGMALLAASQVRMRMALDRPKEPEKETPL